MWMQWTIQNLQIMVGVVHLSCYSVLGIPLDASDRGRSRGAPSQPASQDFMHITRLLTIAPGAHLAKGHLPNFTIKVICINSLFWLHHSCGIARKEPFAEHLGEGNSSPM